MRWRTLALLVLLGMMIRMEVHAQGAAGQGSGGQGSGAAAKVDTSAPVKWEFSSLANLDGTYTLFLHGKIRDGWRLYSTTMPDSLPNSRINLDSGNRWKLIQVNERGQMRDLKDPLFDGAATRYFEQDWTVLIGLYPPGSTKENTTSAKGAGDIKGVLTYIARYKDSFSVPTEVPFRYSVGADGKLVVKAAGLHASANAAASLEKSSIDLAHPVHGCGGTGADEGGGWLSIFILGFIGGLVALIMPCTFPMIPLTVSFFTNRSKSRSRGITNASLYGFFIFLIYTLLSVPFYFQGSSANIFNTISTNVWLNLAYSVIFIVFALSFFGLFEITLPSRFTNTVSSKSNISSVGGIFFMALTLVIVSFSCTGPILGTFLVEAISQKGGPVNLTLALGGFGIGLGLPFALFALFPAWLQSLPRSGGWMTTVKVSFAFIELAFALKYLSNADLVAHWGILKRETFFALWIVIGSALVLYLFGFLKIGHDAPPEKLSIWRKIFGWTFLIMVLYLAPGVTNTKYANLSLVSGFPPPLSYSLYGKGSVKDKGVEANVINDYDKALQLAREQHKPILIDFTGWACVNCRKMEENVWPRDSVRTLIKEHFILVSLYVDDRKALPEDQQFLFTTKDGSQKEIRTVGDKYATLQSENFQNASQPLYAIISPDEKLLNKPVGYTPDVKDYSAWLRCGLDAYKNREGVAKAGE